MAEDEKAKAAEDGKTLEQKEAAVRIEQDNRVQKVKTEAEAASAEAGKPEKGTNLDG